MAVSGQTAAQAVLDPTRGPGSADPKLAHGADLEVAATAAGIARTRDRSNGRASIKNVGIPQGQREYVLKMDISSGPFVAFVGPASNTGSISTWLCCPRPVAASAHGDFRSFVRRSKATPP